VDSRHDHGLGFDLAKHAILAVQQILHLKHRLPRAWECMKAWKLELPIAHRVPIPLDLARALFGLALDRWFSQENSGLLLPLAVLVRVAFFGLLRLGEIFMRKRLDVLVKDLHTNDAIAVLIIRRPRKRAALGRRQFSVIRDVSTVRWLAWMIQDLGNEANLWPSSGTCCRNMFRGLVGLLGCGRIGLTPGCLRPGGTTWLFMQGQDISRIQFLVRWATLGSLQSYIQDAMGHLVWIPLNAEEQAVLSAAV
jgi:hypothetical protein